MITPEALAQFNMKDFAEAPYERYDGYGIPFILYARSNGTSDVTVPDPGFNYRMMAMFGRARDTTAGLVAFELSNSSIMQMQKGTTDHQCVHDMTDCKDTSVSYGTIGEAITVDGSTAGNADCYCVCIKV